MEAKQTVREMLVEATTAAGTKGMRAQELYAYVAERRKVSACDSALVRALEQGHLVRLGRAHEARYFANRDDLEAGRAAWKVWAAERRAKIIEGRKAAARAVSERKAALKPKVVKEVKRTPPKSVVTRAPWNVNTPGIITPKTKFTIAPPPPDPMRTNTYARSW